MLIPSFWRIRTKQQSGAMLLAVMALLAALAVLFVAILTFVLVRYGEHQRTINRITARHLANAGLTRCLEDAKSGMYNKETQSDQSPNGGIITTSIQPWGAYLLCLSSGQKGNQVVRASALLGSLPPELLNAAITVCDERYPLIVSGNSHITGDINTGLLGATSGRMEGEGPIADSFLSGTLHTFQNLNFPKTDTKILEQYFQNALNRKKLATAIIHGSHIETGASTSPLLTPSILNIENNLEITSGRFAYNQQLHSIFANGHIEITGQSKISGMAELVSESFIKVSGNAVCDQILLYAKDSIVFEGSAAFSGQAITQGIIIVRDKAQLRHPSAIVAFQNQAQVRDSTGIKLMSSQRLEGLCFVANGSNERREIEPLLFVDSTVTFTGTLLSEALTRLNGTIHGTLLTEQFYYKIPPTTYVNWIRNAKINRSRLQYTPVLPILTTETNNPFAWLRQDIES